MMDDVTTVLAPLEGFVPNFELAFDVPHRWCRFKILDAETAELVIPALFFDSAPRWVVEQLRVLFPMEFAKNGLMADFWKDLATLAWHIRLTKAPAGYYPSSDPFPEGWGPL